MTNYYQNFVDKVMADLGFENLADDKKNQVMETIKQRMDQKILFTIMANIKDEDISELETLTEKNTPPEELVKFMSSKIENLDDKITQALGELYQQMVEDVKTISKNFKKE